MFSKHNLVLFLLLVIGIFTRFVKLNWGDGFFFHPDENNMASAVATLSPQSFDPHFYAYGQFPLYLSYITGVLINILTSNPDITKVSFDLAVMTLRFYSALSSFLSILFFYKICQLLFEKKYSAVFIALTLFVFSPGLIQLAHFGTTESLLITIFLALIYLSFIYLESPQIKYIVISSFLLGIGLASKTSALIFVTPLVLSMFYNFVSRPSVKLVGHGLVLLVLTLLFAALLTPYSLINFPDFVSSMRYETEVATGQLKVFYTNQFLDSIPYVFQLVKIFPYSSGIFQFTFALIGLIIFLTIQSRHIKQEKIIVVYWSLILLPSLVYFLYFGQLYTKWFRFMSPIFFVIPLLSAIFLNQIKHIFTKYVLVILGIIPSLFFLKIYFAPDIRHQFSNWFLQNIPSNTTILSEAGNVVNLPFNENQYSVVNFDFYNLDSSQQNLSTLSALIETSEYILIPSRRVFSNQANARFPVSQNYYSNLFVGQLGYSPIITQKSSNFIFIDPENAEETFTVFDHPTIRLYKKVKHLDSEYITKLLTP